MKYLLALLFILASSANSAFGYNTEDLANTIQQAKGSYAWNLTGKTLTGLLIQANQYQDNTCGAENKVDTGDNIGITRVCIDDAGKPFIRMSFQNCYRVETFSSSQQAVGELKKEFAISGNARNFLRTLKAAGEQDIAIVTQRDGCLWKLSFHEHAFLPLMAEMYNRLGTL